jgi:uncharacterized protein (DUF433 family)
MTHQYADWQLTELAKLAQADPERAERALNALWASVPGLFEDLARSAGIPCDSASASDEPGPTFALVEVGGTSAARLAESRIAVWEIVRVHRRTGSMDELAAAFPSVERDELEAAIQYGLQHQTEIELLINRYESMIEQRRAQYPYTR